MFLPMKCTDDGHSGLEFLKEATLIFKEWQKSGNSGLSAETFLACIQTMTAVPALAAYLQEQHGFKYLLSGRLMSDPIEGRFGWYRQCNGANFFVSVKQVLAAEKKIRCLSILQQKADDIVQILETSSRLRETLVKACQIQQKNIESGEWLYNFLSAAAMDELPDTDAAVAYFVSGYIGRSVGTLRKCAACKEMLVSKDCASDIQTDIPEKLKVIFALANRGGLSEPTEFCFATTTVAVRCYTTISGNVDIMKKLLQASNQRQVFVTAVRKWIETSPLLSGLLNAECPSSKKHKNFDLVIQASFNCFAVNELKRLNSKPAAEEIPAKTLRKIRKLSSKSSSTKQ